MSPSLGSLQNDGRVIIIGGGPGGTGCALALHTLATKLGRKINITVIEGKTFEGGVHYNQCAGVLSSPLPTLLTEKLAVPFPTDLVRETVQGYILHADNQSVRLVDTGENSTALRRVHFDAYMLAAVKQRGIEVHSARMTGLEFLPDEVRVYTECGSSQADVVVGAFGLDEGSATLLSRQTAYRTPRFINSVVTKYHPPLDEMEKFGQFVHAFLPKNSQIEFGAITPKGNHLTFNIAGKNVDADVMNSFLESDFVHNVLPPSYPKNHQNELDFTFFKGRFPNSLASNFYGDRYVTVGDAAGLVRAFKGKGVTSAIQTGIRAAETILLHGISKSAFHNHYRNENQDIIRDLPYGQGMRFFTLLLTRLGLMQKIVQTAQNSPILQTILFDAVSAHATYRSILSKSLKPNTFVPILRALLLSAKM